MASTKIPAELSSTPGIIDNSNATAITIDSSENVGVGTTTPDEFTLGGTYKYFAVGGTGKTGIINIIDKTTQGSYLQFGTAAGVRRASIHALDGSHLCFNTNTNNSGTSVPEKMRITSAGNVGIGVTNPQYKLVVSNGGASGLEFGPGYSGTANLIQSYNRSGSAYVHTVYDAAVHRFNISGNQKFKIDSTGNVGIGTESPSSLLHITSNDSTTNDAVNMMFLTALSTGTTTTGFGPAIVFQAERNNGVMQNTGKIRSIATVNSGTNISSGLAFETGTVGVLNERMRLMPDGQLLLNKTGSDVGASTNILEADGNFRLQGGTRSIKFNDASHEIVGMAQIASNKMQYASGRMTIDVGNSRVGIGTSSPSYKLDISGTGDTVQYIANANPSHSTGRTLLIRDNYASSSQNSKISYAATSSPGQDVYLGKRTTSNAGYFHLTNSSGTEHLTVNMASGNVGIGTTSPNGNLHVGSSNATGDATNPAIQVGGANTYRLGLYTDSEAAYIHNANGDNGIRFHIKTLGEVARLVGGNGALGVRGAPPSDANSSYPLIAVGTSTFMQGLNDSNESFFGNNSYWASDNSWHRATVGKPAQIAFADGETLFRTSSSAGSGSNITWVESARFTNHGNLKFVGQTTNFESPGFTYHTNNYLYLRGGSAGLILADDSNLNTVQIIDGSSGYVNFETGDGSTRMRILHSGEVHITGAGSPINPTIKHSGATGDVAKLRLINRSGQSSNKGGLLEMGAVTDDGVSRSDVFASIAGLKDNAISGNKAGYMQFMTSNGSSLAEKMRLDSNGHLILGSNHSTTEAGKLSIYTDATNDPALYGYRSTSEFKIVPFLSNGAFSSLSSVNDSGLFFSDNFVIAKHSTGNYGMKVFGDGNITFGTKVAQSKYTFQGVTTGNIVTVATGSNANANVGAIIFRDGANDYCGQITCNGGTNSVSYVSSSDYRLKENVNYTWDATTRLKQLKPARFNWIDDDTNTLVDGFLAHEVSDIVPEAINGEKDAMKEEEYEVTPAKYEDDGETLISEAVTGTRKVPVYQGIDHSKLVPLLVKTIQELEARIKVLEDK